jgi:hypothetical protein
MRRAPLLLRLHLVVAAVLLAAACDTGGSLGLDSGPGVLPDGGPGTFPDAGGPIGPPPWQPAPGTTWQWQLSGTIDTSVDAEVYDIDLFEAPQAAIDELHAKGKKVICYFSAGSLENGRPDAAQFPAAAVGNVLDGWPDERWLDTRSLEVRAIMQQRLALAVARHCDAVEPDNVDAYAQNSGFPLTADDQLDYDTFLANQAHTRGLSVGLKNDLEQIPQLVGFFDWALDEECVQYTECDQLTPFIDEGKAVFHAEYGDATLASTVCPVTAPLMLSTIIKHLELDAFRVTCP